MKMVDNIGGSWELDETYRARKLNGSPDVPGVQTMIVLECIWEHLIFAFFCLDVSLLFRLKLLFR